MESFFFPELKELIWRGCEVLVVPRSCKGVVEAEYREFLVQNTAAKPLCSFEILEEAFLQFIRKPRLTLQLFYLLLATQKLNNLVKNLAIFPKGVWLGCLAKKWGATHIHAQWSSTTASMALVASKVSGIPWSFTAHRGDLVENNLLNSKMREATFVRFISKKSLKLANDLGMNHIQGKVRIIHMGVSLPPQNPDVDSRASPPVILCPASLRPVKGHKYLLQAMAILKKRGIVCSLLLVGSGPLEKDLRRRVHDLAITDIVTFLGQIPNAELLQLEREGKVGIVVLPSVDLGGGEHEGIPVTLMEAMSNGIPVIATRTGGIPELLEDGAGILVPPEDPAALADSIQRLLEDISLRVRLTRTGKKRIEEQFAVETVVNEIVASIAHPLVGKSRCEGIDVK
jgi:glycosyltransferase involved in cell wall biosynthesis